MTARASGSEIITVSYKSSAGIYISQLFGIVNLVCITVKYFSVEIRAWTTIKQYNQYSQKQLKYDLTAQKPDFIRCFFLKWIMISLQYNWIKRKNLVNLKNRGVTQYSCCELVMTTFVYCIQLFTDYL